MMLGGGGVILSGGARRRRAGDGEVLEDEKLEADAGVVDVRLGVECEW